MFGLALDKRLLIVIATAVVKSSITNCPNQMATLMLYVLSKRATCLYGYDACTTVNAGGMVRLIREGWWTTEPVL